MSFLNYFHKILDSTNIFQIRVLMVPIISLANEKPISITRVNGNLDTKNTRKDGWEWFGKVIDDYSVRERMEYSNAYSIPW